MQKKSLFSSFRIGVKVFFVLTDLRILNPRFELLQYYCINFSVHLLILEFHFLVLLAEEKFARTLIDNAMKNLVVIVFAVKLTISADLNHFYLKNYHCLVLVLLFLLSLQNYFIHLMLVQDLFHDQSQHIITCLIFSEFQSYLHDLFTFLFSTFIEDYFALYPNPIFYYQSFQLSYSIFQQKRGTYPHPVYFFSKMVQFQNPSTVILFTQIITYQSPTNNILYNCKQLQVNFENQYLYKVIMKDFSQDYLDPNKQPEYLDPYLYVNPIVENQIYKARQKRLTIEVIKAGLWSVITAPIQTITISLQLSIPAHKNMGANNFLKKQSNLNSNQKTVSKLNTNLTLQEKRKLQIQIRSQSNQPYNAPTYSGYRETIKSLFQQGWKAFFKGTFFRICHSSLHLYPILYYDNLVNQQKLLKNPVLSLGELYLMKVGVDILTNCLQIGQNRYILQNNIEEFKVYRGGWKFLKKLSRRGDLWKGWKFHFINNIFDVFTRSLFLLSLSSYQHNFQGFKALVIPYYLGQFVTYPLTTAYRRYICQCTQTPGMIPLRYSSITHALKVIYFEEGLKGLWRGFLLHHATLGIRIALPLLIAFRNES